MDDRAHDEFLDRLYAAAITGEDWGDALQSYTKLLSSQAAFLQIHDLQTGFVGAGAWVGYSDDFIQRGRAWFDKDPWTAAGHRMAKANPSLNETGLFFRGAKEVRYRDFVRSEYYNEYVGEVSVADTLVGAVASESRYGLSIAAHTWGGEDDIFDDEQARKAQFLFKDFKRALTMHVALAKKQSYDAMASLWTATEIPLVLVSGGRIVHTNKQAEIALAAGDVITARGQRFAFFDTALGEVAAALQANRGPRQAARVTFGRSGTRYLVQIVRFNQFRTSVLGQGGIDSGTLLIALTDLGPQGAGRRDAIGALSGLTQAELAIANSLASGERVEDIAESRQLTVQTVRWHVRNLIEKIGARSLADLIRTLSLLLPL